MSVHKSTSPEDAADRLAIREPIDAYGTFADRRLPQQQADLHIAGGRTLVFQVQPPSRTRYSIPANNTSRASQACRSTR